MPTIFDYVNSKEIAVYYTEGALNQIPYLGETLFPAKKQIGLDLSWIKGSKGLPVALKPSNFDAKATLRERIGFEKLSTEMPFFREGMRIGEKDRQQLNTFMAAQNKDLIMPLINNIYDDATNLINGARVQAERMRMQLLSTGKIAILENRMPYDYDYKFDSNNKETLTGTDMWSDSANSNPVADIQNWQDDVEDRTGIRVTRAICTRKTWNYLMQNEKIRLDMNPIGGHNIIMTDSMLKQYLSQKLGLTIAVYNKKYSLDVKTPTSDLFFPDDLFTMIPPGTLGNTYYGTTPEESDLMTGQTDAKVEIVNTGIAITTIKEPHPVNVETIVSGIFLPSFEAIDNIFIATVHA